MHEAGHLFAAKKAGIRVEAFSLGMGKRLFGKKIGDTDYRFSIIPFGGFCKMAGEDPDEAQGAEDEFNSKPVGHRFWVLAAGALTNYVFAFIVLCIIYMVGIPSLSSNVGQVLPDYPAKKAGILVEDKIVSINNVKVRYWEDIVDAIKKETVDENTILAFQVERKGKDLTIDVKPKIYSAVNVFGQKISQPMIGIAPENTFLSVSYNPVKAIYHGGKKILKMTATTYKGIWLIITGGMPVKASISGPIGIAQMLGQAAHAGIIPLLMITAHISMAIAIFNLLPFPILDGGHILFLGIEKLRRRPLSLRFQDVITQIALVMLLSFAFFVSWQDVVRIYSSWGK